MRTATPRGQRFRHPAFRLRRHAVLAAGCGAALCLSMRMAPAETSPRAQAKQQLAIRAAARDVLDTLSNLATTNAAESALLVEDLRRMMVNHVEHHTTVDQSRAASRVRLTHARRRAIEDLVDHAATRAHEQSPLPVTGADVLARLGAAWEQQKEDAVEGFVERFLDPLFRSARERAVTAQSAELDQSLAYPDFEAVDRTLMEHAPDPAAKPLDPEAFRRIRPWVQSLVRADQLVFEENQPVVRQLGEKILAEIQQQYAHQIEAIRQPIEQEQVPADCILRSDIEAVLLSALDAAAAGVEPGPGAPAYPPFTAARVHAAAQAEHLRDTRLLTDIERPDAIGIDPQALAGQIEENPAHHRTPAQSRKLLLEHWIAALHRPFAERYAARSKRPAVNQVDLLLLDDKRIGGAFRKRIDRALNEQLPPLRERLAQEQFQRLFPALHAATPFPDEAIEFLHDAQSPRIDGMGLLRQVLEVDPALTPQPHAANALFVETEKLALDAANAHAEPLVRALGAQLRLLSEIADENAEPLRRDVEADTPFEEIKTAWRNELDQRWRQSSGDVPERARELFARTRYELDKTVRQLYDTLREERDAQAAAQAQAAEGEAAATPEHEAVDVTEEVEEEPPQEDLEETLAGLQEELLSYRGFADFVFVLADGPNETGLVVFGHPSEGMVANAQFSPTAIEAAAETIAQAASDHFRTVLQARAQAARGPRIFFWRDRTPLLRVLVLEHSREMRHLSSILLQQKIKQRIKDWEQARNTRFDLDWQESPGRRK